MAIAGNPKARIKQRSTAAILAFHEVGRPMWSSRFRGMTVPAILFRAYVRELQKQGYSAMSMQALVDAWNNELPVPERSIVFTFDDAYSGVYEYALPCLEAAGWSATIYVVTSEIGGRNSWMSGREGNRRLMNQSQIVDAFRRGFEIGSHSHSHMPMTVLTDDRAIEELQQSRNWLQEVLSVAPESFAYPYGFFDHRIQELVKATGYKSACTVADGKANASCDHFALPRVNIASWQIMPHQLLRMIETTQEWNVVGPHGLSTASL
jgi:peptidoglycan/xylan/chitin deacetylase (PgdA/CDA1 family)